MNERILFSKENYTNLITPELKGRFSLVMQLASEAKAYPDQSGYFVRTAGMTKDGIYYKGGNKEYGFSDAFIHGETAVVSGLRDLTDSPIEIIGWHKDGEITSDDFGRPCGNCRDILKKYCSPETYLLNGNENSYVVTQLKDFLFEDYRWLNMGHVHGFEVNAAVLSARGGTDVYLPEAMKPEIYGAVLVSKDGSIWPGGHYSNVGYDSVTPVLNAILSWKNSYPLGTVSEKHLGLLRLVVASESGIPRVFYRDRQALLEQDEILRKYTHENPLRVELVHAKRDTYGNLFIYNAKMTDSEEWLPRPFSPGAFRMDDVMLGQLGKMIGADNLKSLHV